MEKEWAWEGDLMGSLRSFLEKLMALNIDVFGSILRRKRRVRSKLEGVMRVMEVSPIVGLLNLERKPKRELTEVLVQEVLWVQKLQVDWLRFGIKIPRFFIHPLW